MRLLALGIGLSLLCGPAAAQQVDPAVAAAAQSRKAFDDCVYESVAAQLHQIPIGARRIADFSSLGEQGFLACATEERVLGMTLSINNVSPQVVQAALLVARAQIKRTLRDIAANAEKNGAPQQSQAKSPTGEPGGGYLVLAISGPRVMPNLPLGAYSDGSSADAMCRASAILGTSSGSIPT